MSRKFVNTAFLSRKFINTHSSIAFEDLVDSSIAPHIKPHWSGLVWSGLVWYREQFITLESYLRMRWDISFTDCTYNTRAPLAVQFHYIFNQCFCPMSSSTDDADELNMKVQPPQNGSNMGIQPKAFVFCICYFLVSRFVFCKAL